MEIEYKDKKQQERIQEVIEKLKSQYPDSPLNKGQYIAFLQEYCKPLDKKIYKQDLGHLIKIINNHQMNFNSKTLIEFLEEDPWKNSNEDSPKIIPFSYFEDEKRAKITREIVNNTKSF